MLSSIVFKIFSFIAILFFGYSTQSTDLYKTNSSLHFRSGPGMQYSSTLVLQKGDTLELLELSNQTWAKVKYKNSIGYVSEKYITPIQSPTLPSTQINKDEPQEASTSGTFITLLIIFLVCLVIGFAIKTIGNKRKSKAIAFILALFFGTFGYHKFYLGKPKLGTLYLLFSWTLIPTFIGFIECILIYVMKEHEFEKRYNNSSPDRLTKKSKFTNTKNNRADNIIKSESKTSGYSNNHTQGEVSNTISTQPIDESIIDVSSEELNLKIQPTAEKQANELTPPFWKQFYVYAYDDITKANQTQLKFYKYLKEKVSRGEFVDIENNTNYAFILYFDFFEEYKTHQNIQKLDNQIQVIARICPKTKPYSFKILEDLLQKRNDSYSINRLEEIEDSFTSHYSDYNPDLYKLGTQYKNKLSLSSKEIKWLNKFYNPTNVFLAIEGCCIGTIKYYLLILKKLDTQFKNSDSSLDNEIKEITQLLKEYYTHEYSEWDYYDNTYLEHQSESEIYLTIFKRIENLVREGYGHKRKVSGDFSNVSPSIVEVFEIKIGNQVNKLINQLEDKLEKPDFNTQIALNSQNVNRWKNEFSFLKENFNVKEIKQFIANIKYLEDVNQKNPNIENIFFEASKFIARYDKIQALKYYAKYIFYDLNSKKFDNKTLTKTVKKSLFKNEEQLNNFRSICSELIQTKDLNIALQKIDSFYLPKRKKIKLNQSAIQEVENKHENTVELLNEYLTDSSEIELTSDSETEVEIISDTANKEIDYLLTPEINLNKVQESLIKQIIENSFSIDQAMVDEFATQNGLFKNQLIDSINEACEDYLDGEAFLEEDGDYYIIEESFYEEIKNKQ